MSEFIEGCVMGLFVIRGVDGQVGIVTARHTQGAVERLDEFANFEGCPVRRMPDLMLLLDINDEGELTLVQVGEETAARIRAFAYPLVDRALSDRSASHAKKVRRAVQGERSRVKRQALKSTLTSRGREIQHALDLPTSIVRRYERRAASATLARTPVPAAKKRH